MGPLADELFIYFQIYALIWCVVFFSVSEFLFQSAWCLVQWLQYTTQISSMYIHIVQCTHHVEKQSIFNTDFDHNTYHRSNEKIDASIAITHLIVEASIVASTWIIAMFIEMYTYRKWVTEKSTSSLLLRRHNNEAISLLLHLFDTRARTAHAKSIFGVCLCVDRRCHVYKFYWCSFRRLHTISPREQKNERKILLMYCRLSYHLIISKHTFDDTEATQPIYKWRGKSTRPFGARSTQK